MRIIDFEKPTRHSTPLVLPPSNTARWVANRKAAVVIAVRHRAISRKHACERYQLSREELASWEAAFEQYGVAGLRVSCRRLRLSQTDAPVPRIRAGFARRMPDGVAIGSRSTTRGRRAPA
jgi:hypothetical protein